MSDQVERETDVQIGLALTKRIDENILRIEGAVQGMAAFWNSSQEVTEAEFKAYVTEALPDLPGLVAVDYLDADNTVRYVAMGGALDASHGRSLEEIPGAAAAMAQAKATNQPAMSPPSLLLDGRPGVVVFQPLKDERGNRGLIAAAVAFEDLLATVRQDMAKQGYGGEVAYDGIRIPADGKSIHDFDLMTPLPKKAVTVTEDVLGQSWRLIIWRTDGEHYLRSYLYACVNAAVVFALIGLIVALRRRHTALQEALQREREFVSIVSHQLREPLTQMSWACDALLEAEGVPAAEKGQLSKMQGIVRRAVRLTNDLLNVSRLERGILPINLEIVPMATVIDDVLTVMRPLAEGRKISLNVAVPSGLNVLVDRVKAAEAVRNIVDNAIKYSPEGSAVEIVAASSGGVAQLAIGDHGPGIPEEMRASFFERSTASMRRGTGTGAGLGMYLTKMFLEKMGGTIAFTTGDKGTTFLIKVQLANGL